MIEVRPAVRGDADPLAAAHIEGWRTGYRGVVPDEYLDSDEFAAARRATWRAWSWNSGGRSALFTGLVAGRPVGFGLCGPERAPHGDERGEVFSFYVHPDAWGSGVAGTLMAACERWLAGQGYRDAMLWVLRDNPRARAFYVKSGWELTGRESTFAGPVTAAALPEPLVEVEYCRRLSPGRRVRVSGEPGWS